MKMMFGGGAPGGKSSSKPKVKPKRIAVDVTLENIYKGELVQVDVKRYRIC
jgi:DnaJ-class molecular chaperone